MDIVVEIILSIIQGITELLPVSSSGHLMLLSELAGYQISLELIAFLHFTTGLAILVGFWKEIRDIFKAKNKSKILLTFLIAIAPTTLTALFLFDHIEQYVHNSIPIILISLGFWGTIMIIVDHFYFKNSKGYQSKQLSHVSFKDAFLIGVAQTLAFIPGTSRSGITIMTGIIVGLDRYTAVVFSFLVGIPVIIGSFIFETFRNPQILDGIFSVQNTIFGVISFIFALLTLQLLKRIINMKFLTFLGIYRVIIAITFAILLLT